MALNNGNVLTYISGGQSSKLVGKAGGCLQNLFFFFCLFLASEAAYIPQLMNCISLTFASIMPFSLLTLASLCHSYKDPDDYIGSMG